MLISKLECTKIIIIVFFSADSPRLWSPDYNKNLVQTQDKYYNRGFRFSFRKNYYTNTLVFLAQKISTN